MSNIVYRAGQKQARLFIFGFAVVSVAYIMIISDAFGFSTFLDVVPNILMWATIIEVLSLTLAFSDRYKIIKNEVIEKKAQLNSALKNKEILIKEVHHRVKNYSFHDTITT